MLTYIVGMQVVLTLVSFVVNFNHLHALA